MKRNFFLLFLEACILALFYELLSFSLLESFFISYCFVSLIAILFNKPRSIGVFKFLFFFHLLGICLYLGLMFYNAKSYKPTYVITPAIEKTFENTIYALSPPEKDRNYLVRAISYTILLQFHNAQKIAQELTPSEIYTKPLTKWIIQKEKGFQDLIKQATQRQKYVKNILPYIYKGEYNTAYSRLSLLKPFSEIEQLKNMIYSIIQIQGNINLLEEEVMRKHIDFIRFSPISAEKTLELIPGTLNFLPNLLKNLDQSPVISLFDFYSMRDHLNTLEVYKPVQLKIAKNNIYIENIVKDWITGIYWGINSKVGSRFYSLIKILPHQIITLENGKSVTQSIKNIQKSIKDSVEFFSNPFYLKWLEPQYIALFSSYYKEKILPVHKQILYLVFGFLIISLFAGITNKALFSLIKTEPNKITYGFISIFIIFLCYIFYGMTYILLDYAIPILFHL